MQAKNPIPLRKVVTSTLLLDLSLLIAFANNARAVCGADKTDQHPDPSACVRDDTTEGLEEDP